MADFDSSLPVRSEVNNSTSDLQVSIADGTTNTQLWVIDTNGIGQVNLNDGTNSLAVGSNGEITTIVTDGTDTINIDGQGNVGNVVYDSTGANAWSIDANNAGAVKVQDGDSPADVMAVNDDGSINVNVVQSTTGDQIHVYDTEASIPADDTPVTVVSYTVTTGKTLLLRYVHAASSGKAKVLVLAGTPSSETVRAVFFISTANGFGFAEFPYPIEVAAGDNVLVQMANLDKTTQDGYAYINGMEV